MHTTVTPITAMCSLCCAVDKLDYRFLKHFIANTFVFPTTLINEIPIVEPYTQCILIKSCRSYNSCIFRAVKGFQNAKNFVIKAQQLK